MHFKIEKLLSLFLWLVALHSFLVGIGLIFLPSSAFEYLGFDSTFDRFFSTQGGVFHIAMSVCYAMAAKDLIKYKQLIIFSIIVKFIATVFLLSYYFLVSSQWMIIFSCITDFIIGMLILYLYRTLIKQSYFDHGNQ
jgi:hypothetical protein